MPKVKLPAHWTKSNVESVREECARYRDMSLEQRAQELHLVCQGVPAALARYSPEHRAAIAAADDRLPESTRVALERLRREYRGRRP